MTRLRRGLALLIIIFASTSNVLFSNSTAGGGVTDVGGLPEVLQEGGCFGVSTRLPGAEGAFPVIATDGAGGVYVAYQSQRRENGSDPYLHVYFAYSHDYGETWSESLRVDDEGSPSVLCDSPSIAVDRLSGHVYVAWKDNRTGVAKAYVDRSVDRGASFGPDVLVYDWPNDQMFMGLPYTVNVEAGGDGVIYMAWMAYDGYSLTDCDILLARSADGGETFSAPATVNPPEGEARHSHPWILVDGGVVYVAYSMRNAATFGAYMARSQDRGSTFGTPVKINDDSAYRYRGGP